MQYREFSVNDVVKQALSRGAAVCFQRFGVLFHEMFAREIMQNGVYNLIDARGSRRRGEIQICVGD